MNSEKVRENRLRRMANRQGLVIRKSPRRDPRAVDYNRWHIADAQSNFIVAGGHGFNGWGMTLDDVESYLTED